MKKIVLTFFFIFSLLAPAKDINIGDNISFKISGIPREEILKKFEENNFSIEKIKENKDGSFLVTVKGFNLGKNNVILGDKNLEIEIKSLLKPEEKEIYKDLSDMSNQKLHLNNFPYIFIISVLTSIFLVGFLIKTFKRDKKEVIINYDNKFNTQMELLSKENWAFEISYALREYIDNRYGTHFLNGTYEKYGVLTEEDIIFIHWLDNCKFSGNLQDDLKTSKNKAFDIYKRIKEGEINV